MSIGGFGGLFGGQSVGLGLVSTTPSLGAPARHLASGVPAGYEKAVYKMAVSQPLPQAQIRINAQFNQVKEKERDTCSKCVLYQPIPSSEGGRVTNSTRLVAQDTTDREGQAQVMIFQWFNGVQVPEGYLCTEDCNRIGEAGDVARAAQEMERTLQKMESLYPAKGYVSNAFKTTAFGQSPSVTVFTGGSMALVQDSSVDILEAGTEVRAMLPIPPEFRYASSFTNKRPLVMRGSHGARTPVAYQLVPITEEDPRTPSVAMLDTLRAFAASPGTSFSECHRSKLSQAMLGIVARGVQALVAGGLVTFTPGAIVRLSDVKDTGPAELAGFDVAGQFARSCDRRNTDHEKYAAVLSHALGVGGGSGHAGTSTALAKGVMAALLSPRDSIIPADHGMLGSEPAAVADAVNTISKDLVGAVARGTGSALVGPSAGFRGSLLSPAPQGEIAEVFVNQK